MEVVDYVQELERKGRILNSQKINNCGSDMGRNHFFDDYRTMDIIIRRPVLTAKQLLEFDRISRSGSTDKLKEFYKRVRDKYNYDIHQAKFNTKLNSNGKNKH